MIIIGINAFHGDASVAIVRDGVLLYAAEEERFSRLKHAAGFPSRAILDGLRSTSINFDAVDIIAINRSPAANLFRKISYTFKSGSFSEIFQRFKRTSRAIGLKYRFKESGIWAGVGRFPRIIYVEHHMAHLASTFYVSPYQDSAIVSIDGFGDFASAMWGVGRGSSINQHDSIYFPHSLGLLYSALTQFLGFPNYGDEYKMMGLAPYGTPLYLDKLREICSLRQDGKFELNLEYFTHHTGGLKMTWDDGSPTLSSIFSNKITSLLGKERGVGDPLTEFHMDLAASAQALYEEVFFHYLNHVQRESGMTSLCLSGGCAMNSVANGKIFSKTKFMDVYIPPAPGDAGGAIGAAFHVWHKSYGHPRSFQMTHAYYGPKFDEKSIDEVMANSEGEIRDKECNLARFKDVSELTACIAQHIADGAVVGWFQGCMEWGPRALGNRSILADPRNPNMKDILNQKIKRRESFRPFAPSIMQDCTEDWFEVNYPVPFMLQVFQVKEAKRALIPAVTHVNGSGRLQTVTIEQNERYYRLLQAFYAITGVPMLLNTSFNENEPVVCNPGQAIDCFLRTNMDILVLDNLVITRRPLN